MWQQTGALFFDAPAPVPLVRATSRNIPNYFEKFRNRNAAADFRAVCCGLACGRVGKTPTNASNNSGLCGTGYPLTHAQLLLAKVRPHAIPVDAQGLIVGAGRRTAPRVRAAFVTPSHQFPTGVTLSMARRLELLAWARQSGAFIIEDDYTSEFRYSGPPLASLQGLDDTEQVIYVGTLNKALFPGLRIGYAVVPRAVLPAFVSARYLVDRQPATMQQAVVSEFMQQGHFAAHIRRMRELYREQRDALAQKLMRRGADRLDVITPDQGMHLVAYLRDGSSDTALEAIAQRAGIVVRAISRFYRAARPRPGLMLGFSGFPRQLIVPAAARLAMLVANRDRA